ncbi:hypothetical protein GY21_10100 [Cryobacterium roopkundense]|uniref:Uncharacterized protein (TIGR03084 family) n=1 Tax=Cryobacterium roopkundense TaxID=1001240 RepID=A0A099JBJ3_9MICO|nr:TIGR03084 family metal-binding protein [Cryobacterium roopkundense]KGJ74877.1 hypothetical protein GY21_10100 [Cryobacterium roopkundense]MBB5640622.1 uncharacterized protein (TIGR03084 family) [Cryobacterium roopkundense]
MPIDETAFLALLADVETEAAELNALLAPLTLDQWRTATPADGWDIHDQVVHLAHFDDLAALGFTDPAALTLRVADLLAAGDDWIDQINVERVDLAPERTLEWFSASRRGVVAALAAGGPSSRTPWFGPPMSAASAATARLMETWAHGQDIRDALGVPTVPSDRLRHICQLGVLTRRFSFQIRGMSAPTTDIRVELESPGGDTWVWGPADAEQRVGGSALDFALRVTQRRHLDDLSLTGTPGAAQEWLAVAQAFAGTVGAGRAPGQFDRNRTSG